MPSRPNQPKKREHRERRRPTTATWALSSVTSAAAAVLLVVAATADRSPSSLASSWLTASANAQPVPAAQWSYNVSDNAGPLNWGTILNTDGDTLYPSCFMDDFPAPRRFHDVHLTTVLSHGEVALNDIQLDYLVSNHFKIELSGQGTSRPSLIVSLLDIQCSARHPSTNEPMALQRIEFLIPAENEMGYVNGLEVHLVHTRVDSNNVPISSTKSPEFTIAVFYDGAVMGGTTELSKILARAPQSGDGAVEVTDLTLDASLLLPFKKDYIFFKGVIPKPPCDVSADYALFVQNLYFTSAQINTLRSLLFGSNLAADEHQRNSALISLRNKAALSAKGAKYQYFVSLQKNFPLELPPRFEPFALETKLAIVGFCFGVLAGLVSLVALVFSVCRPRGKGAGKKETEVAIATAQAQQKAAATKGEEKAELSPRSNAESEGRAN